MIRSRIKRGLKRRLRGALTRTGLYVPPSQRNPSEGTSDPETIVVSSTPLAESPEPVVAAPEPVIAVPDPVVADNDKVSEDDPAFQIPSPDYEPGLTAPAPDFPLNFDNVDSILEEMIRPALQADGGDITLLKVENGDVYVKLVGACTTCPSSTMTMKMGVERVLFEEFEELREVIQV